MQSLLNLVNKRKILTEPEVRYFMSQLIFGVRYIHANQIVNRDLKLGNLFLSENMVLKIGDFGLASAFNSQSQV